MKRLLALLALLILPAVSSADEPTEVKVPKPKIDFQKQHELRFSGGAFPTMGDIASYPYWIGNTINGTRSYNGPTYASGCYTLSYDFRFKKWFDLGVALSYYGEFGSKYSNVDNSKIGNNSSQYISVMPVVRFTWLNRPWVRMYSSLGVGMVFAVASLLSLIVLLLSVGSVANTIVISVDKDRKFLGLMKAMGLKRKGVSRIVICQSLFMIAAGVVLGIAFLYLLRPVVRSAIASFITSMAGMSLPILLSVRVSPLLPVATAAAFFLAAVLFSRGSVDRIARQDAIAAINEVS